MKYESAMLFSSQNVGGRERKHYFQIVRRKMEITVEIEEIVHTLDILEDFNHLDEDKVEVDERIIGMEGKRLLQL